MTRPGKRPINWRTSEEAAVARRKLKEMINVVTQDKEEFEFQLFCSQLYNVLGRSTSLELHIGLGISDIVSGSRQLFFLQIGSHRCIAALHYFRHLSAEGLLADDTHAFFLRRM